MDINWKDLVPQAWAYVNTFAGMAMVLSIGATQILKTWATRQERELSGGQMKALSALITLVGFYLFGWLGGFRMVDLRTPTNVINVVIAAIGGPYVAQVGKWALAKYLNFDINTLASIPAKAPSGASSSSQSPAPEPPAK